MRRVPRLRSDEEVEAFLGQDLSDLDFGQFRAGRLELECKVARLTMRLPQPMLQHSSSLGLLGKSATSCSINLRARQRLSTASSLRLISSISPRRRSI